MGVRKLLNELMVISPLLFIGCITVHARTRVDPYMPAQYSPVMQERILAYVEPVRMVEDTLYRGIYNADRQKLRDLARLWVRMTDEGTLKPLPPEAKDDSTRDGVKGQIRRAADELAAGLQLASREEAARGELQLAAQDALLAMKVVQGLKHSDLYSVGVFSVRQNASLAILNKLAPKLPPETGNRVSAALAALSQSEKPLTELVFLERRTSLTSLDESRLPWTLRRQLQLMIEAAEALDKSVSSQKTKKISSRLAQAVRADEALSVLAEFRFAWNARRTNLLHIEETQTKLSTM